MRKFFIFLGAFSLSILVISCYNEPQTEVSIWDGAVLAAIIGSGTALVGCIVEHVWVLKRLGSFKDSQLESQIGCASKDIPSLTDQHKRLGAQNKAQNKELKEKIIEQLGCGDKDTPSLTKQHDKLFEQSNICKCIRHGKPYER